MSQLDLDYARRKLAVLTRDLNNYTRDEFWREMSRIASGATGLDHAEQLNKRNAELRQRVRDLECKLAARMSDALEFKRERDELAAHVETIKNKVAELDRATRRTYLSGHTLITHLHQVINESPQTSLAKRDRQQKRSGFELAWQLLEDAAINSLENGYSELKDALDEVKDKSDIRDFDKQVREDAA